MNKTKKALASLAIAGMALTMVPFNAFATGTVPTRLSGTTAAQTAVAIADQTGWTGTAVLASSASYGMVDALTAGPLATFLKAPILLQEPGNVLNSDTKAELTLLNVKTVYVTSGTAVISQAVLNELTGMRITVVPLGGIDKYETSVNIAKKMAGVTKVAVANGLQDALSIAAIASAANEPILLTDKDALPPSVATYVAAGITSSDVIGGTGVISDAVKAQLPSATRHFGNTAYDTNNQVIQDFSSSLDFNNVYVANGVTGIDALAGAPLAAQTKSAIVLTDGTVPAAAATFVHSKLPASGVVTALGGSAVVPDVVRTGVVNGTPTSAQDKVLAPVVVLAPVPPVPAPTPDPTVVLPVIQYDVNSGNGPIIVPGTALHGNDYDVYTSPANGELPFTVTITGQNTVTITNISNHSIFSADFYFWTRSTQYSMGWATIGGEIKNIASGQTVNMQITDLPSHMALLGLADCLIVYDPAVIVFAPTSAPSPVMFMGDKLEMGANGPYWTWTLTPDPNKVVPPAPVVLPPAYRYGGALYNGFLA